MPGRRKYPPATPRDCRRSPRNGFDPKNILEGRPSTLAFSPGNSLETLTFQERIPMKAVQISRILLVSLIFAVMAIAQPVQAGPTPTPSPAPNPTPAPKAAAETAEPADAPPTPFPSPPTSPSPVPKLYLKGQEYYTANGKNFVRYTYDVLNRTDYPAALFAPAPNLPPCGNNTNSSDRKSV